MASMNHRRRPLADPRRQCFKTYFSSVRRRCTNPKDRSYKYVGAKGVRICRDGKRSANFHDWAIANGYRARLCIMRRSSSRNFVRELLLGSTCRAATTHSRRRAEGFARKMKILQLTSREVAHIIRIAHAALGPKRKPTSPRSHGRPVVDSSSPAIPSNAGACSLLDLRSLRNC